VEQDGSRRGGTIAKKAPRAFSEEGMSSWAGPSRSSSSSSSSASTGGQACIKCAASEKVASNADGSDAEEDEETEEEEARPRAICKEQRASAAAPGSIPRPKSGSGNSWAMPTAGAGSQGEIALIICPPAVGVSRRHIC